MKSRNANICLYIHLYFSEKLAGELTIIYNKIRVLETYRKEHSELRRIVVILWMTRVLEYYY